MVRIENISCATEDEVPNIEILVAVNKNTGLRTITYWKEAVQKMKLLFKPYFAKRVITKEEFSKISKMVHQKIQKIYKSSPSECIDMNDIDDYIKIWLKILESRKPNDYVPLKTKKERKPKQPNLREALLRHVQSEVVSEAIARSKGNAYERKKFIVPKKYTDEA